MAKLEIIEGIGPIYAKKLRAAGVRSVEALLRAGATTQGRRELEEKTGIGHEYILDWVNRADLMRIRGVGEEYSDLLEKAGVDTVPELAQRNPDHLHQKIIQVNEVMQLVRRPPTRNMVARWVEQAATGDLPGGPILPPR
jgi:predicted flap endonuclease-1-like 5' DNA nuclease